MVCPRFVKRPVFLLLLLARCHTDSPVCKMNAAVFSGSSLLPYSLVYSWTAVGHTFVLAVCRRSGHLCSICSAVWSSRPHLQIGDGASFIFLNMWASSRLWPVVCSLMTTTCCHRSRKWEVLPLSPPSQRVFFSWKVTLLSCCLKRPVWRGQSYLLLCWVLKLGERIFQRARYFAPAQERGTSWAQTHTKKGRHTQSIAWADRKAPHWPAVPFRLPLGVEAGEQLVPVLAQQLVQRLHLVHLLLQQPTYLRDKNGLVIARFSCGWRVCVCVFLTHTHNRIANKLLHFTNSKQTH